MIFGKDPEKQALNILLNSINVQISEPHSKMLKDWQNASEGLKGCNTEDVTYFIYGISSQVDFLKKNIRYFIKHYTFRALDSDMITTFTKTEINSKKKRVFNWLSRIEAITRTMQSHLGDVIKNPVAFRGMLAQLHAELMINKHLLDLANTLRYISTEYVNYLRKRDENTLLFDEVELHPEIRRAARKDFQSCNYNHAVFEAYKRIEFLVKKKSGKKNLFGVGLMNEIFSPRKPLLKFSSEDEQEGNLYLFRGSMQAIRNVFAHGTMNDLSANRALEYLAFASMLARKIDSAKKNIKEQ